MTEEGVSIEPSVLFPVIPTVLVNGVQCAIATGISCEVPSYNPKDIIRNVRHFLKGEPLEDMVPWYRGFKGTVKAVTDADGVVKSWRTEGLFTRKGNEFTITEVPIGKTFMKLKSDYEKQGKVTVLEDRCTESSVNLRVSVENVETAEAKGLAESLGLVTHISMRNMNLFDPSGLEPKKYKDTGEILKDFCTWRLEQYGRRREHLIEDAEKTISKLSNRARFIKSVVKEPAIVFGKRRPELIDWLVAEKYDKADDSYDYLTKIPIDTFTADEAAKAIKQLDTERSALDALVKTPPSDIWMRDIEAVEKVC